jgi:hypothetical protein
MYYGLRIGCASNERYKQLASLAMHALPYTSTLLKFGVYGHCISVQGT